LADQNKESDVLAKYNLLVPYLTGVSSMAAIAKSSDIPERTLWSWCKKFKEHGLHGLLRQRRSDGNIGKIATEPMRQIVQALCLKNPKPSLTHVHRMLHELSRTNGLKVPSYATVRRIASRISPQVQVMAHDGAKAYGHAYDIVFRREASRPNEIWQSDHSMLDCYVLNDKGKLCRPWLTIVLDDYSRAIAGYYLALDAPASWKTALAYRQAIYRKDDPRWHVFGIPESFYTDHGSDYTSKRIETVSADLKVQLIFSKIGEPRGRGKIERFFRSVNELFLCGFQGYAPGGKMPKGNFLPFEQLDSCFKEWLIADYLPRIHSEIGTSPQTKWENDQFIPRMPENLEQLDLLLCTAAIVRRVHRDGLRFQGLRYMSVDLAGWVGEKVTIRYDPRDLAEINVYQKDKWITRAICQEISSQIVSLNAIQRARAAEKRRVLNVLTDTNKVLDDFISAHRSGEASESEEGTSSSSLKRYFCD
jgi:putative transposase